VRSQDKLPHFFSSLKIVHKRHLQPTDEFPNWGLTEKPDMKITDMKLEDKILYRLKINYITMQCVIFFQNSGRTQVTTAK